MYPLADNRPRSDQGRRSTCTKQRLPGLLGQCYDVIATRTDAPDEFINAAVINLCAALIGRNCTIPFAGKDLIGTVAFASPSTARPARDTPEATVPMPPATRLRHSCVGRCWGRVPSCVRPPCWSWSSASRSVQPATVSLCSRRRARWRDFSTRSRARFEDNDP